MSTLAEGEAWLNQASGVQLLPGCSSGIFINAAPDPPAHLSCYCDILRHGDSGHPVFRMSMESLGSILEMCASAAVSLFTGNSAKGRWRRITPGQSFLAVHSMMYKASRWLQGPGHAWLVAARLLWQMCVNSKRVPVDRKGTSLLVASHSDFRRWPHLCKVSFELEDQWGHIVPPLENPRSLVLMS